MGLTTICVQQGTLDVPSPRAPPMGRLAEAEFELLHPGAVRGVSLSRRMTPLAGVRAAEATRQDAYLKDYAPKSQAAIKAAGGNFLAAGGKTTTIEGEPPKSRIVLQQWDSLEKLQAYRNSAAYKDLLPLREKLAKFRSFTVEGVAN
jgi:uncharacterized protein (DUF1330 family)